VLDFSKPLQLMTKQEDMKEVFGEACQFCEAKAADKV
jgi:hypothetical protein